VNMASRMQETGLPDEIQVSEFTCNLLKDHNQSKDKYRLEPRGLVQVKGKGEVNTYLLKD
jgi:adenylate cyclase